ncbi:MAG TPA: thioesterase family protein [Candidatus Brocadiia bacterium]|nr:thioesterase family protein [Candidatus Brocadiia bacterium]
MSRFIMEFRVEYCDTDQMGTYSSARALEWFERGRTEALRGQGTPYAEMEAKGFMLPVAHAEVDYQGRARYDDLLRMEIVISMQGRARVRFDFAVTQAATGAPVCSGHTLHAVTNPSGRPVRPPAWLTQAIGAPA